jgi:hypothetical protein
MRIIQLSIVACVIALLFSFKKSPALEYVFKEGETYQMTESGSQKISQEIPGMGEVAIEMNTEAISSLRVASITQTGAQLEVHYTSFKVRTKSPQGDIEIDANGDDPNATFLKEMLNKSFDVFISNRGKIEKISRADNLLSSLPENNTQTELLKQFLTEENLRNTFQTIFIEYPSTSIKKGYTWETKEQVHNPYPLETKNSFTFKGVVDKTNQFEKKSNIRTSDDSKVITVNGFNAKTSLSGKTICESSYSTANGWPIKVVSNYEMGGKVTLLAGGGIPFDMSIPMQFNTNSSFEIEKK